MRSYYWHKGRICAEEEKGIPIIKGIKREDIWIHQEIIEERVY